MTVLEVASMVVTWWIECGTCGEPYNESGHTLKVHVKVTQTYVGLDAPLILQMSPLNLWDLVRAGILYA